MEEKRMFKGSLVALITPMQQDGTLDKKSFCELIEWHIAEKTTAVVVAGTTGEAATLSQAEQHEIIALAIKQAAGRLPIIAGTGTNDTKTTLERTLEAHKAGVSACLTVTPYYNKPTQKE